MKYMDNTISHARDIPLTFISSDGEMYVLHHRTWQHTAYSNMPDDLSCMLWPQFWPRVQSIGKKKNLLTLLKSIGNPIISLN